MGRQALLPCIFDVGSMWNTVHVRTIRKYPLQFGGFHYCGGGRRRFFLFSLQKEKEDNACWECDVSGRVPVCSHSF